MMGNLCFCVRRRKTGCQRSGWVVGSLAALCWFSGDVWIWGSRTKFVGFLQSTGMLGSATHARVVIKNDVGIGSYFTCIRNACNCNLLMQISK